MLILYWIIQYAMIVNQPNSRIKGFLLFVLWVILNEAGLVPENRNGWQATRDQVTEAGDRNPVCCKLAIQVQVSSSSWISDIMNAMWISRPVHTRVEVGLLEPMTIDTRGQNCRQRPSTLSDLCKQCDCYNQRTYVLTSQSSPDLSYWITQK